MKVNFLVTLVLMLFLSGCSGLTQVNDNKKSRVFIRSKSLAAAEIPVSEHERRAYQYPHHYFIEGLGVTKKVALTYDDGPSYYTEKLISALAKHQIKASFFMLGTEIKDNLAIVKQLTEQGHLLANHSWDHTDATHYTSAERYWQEQVQPTNQLIHAITGKTPQFFRPPYGSINEQQIQQLINNGMKLIIWSIDTQDWNDEINTANHITELVTTQAHPEAIVLMHDGGGNRQGTVDALEKIVPYYQALGYEFVTLDQLLLNFPTN